MATEVPSKVCATCGRSFTWRKKWERNWDEIRYCSKRCRGGPSQIDDALASSILDLLNERARGATICPSEAARLVALHRGLPDESWRELMEPARSAARRLVANGSVVITQKGAVVDPSTANGPIRLRRAN